MGQVDEAMLPAGCGCAVYAGVVCASLLLRAQQLCQMLLCAVQLQCCFCPQGPLAATVPWLLVDIRGQKTRRVAVTLKPSLQAANGQAGSTAVNVIQTQNIRYKGMTAGAAAWIHF